MVRSFGINLELFMIGGAALLVGVDIGLQNIFKDYLFIHYIKIKNVKSKS